MTLVEFQRRYGSAAMEALAARSATKMSYLRKLMSTPSAAPSARMCVRLIEASEEQLTLRGLVYPCGRD